MHFGHGRSNPFHLMAQFSLQNSENLSNTSLKKYKYLHGKETFSFFLFISHFYQAYGKAFVILNKMTGFQIEPNVIQEFAITSVGCLR
jgi:hypothetical protein